MPRLRRHKHWTKWDYSTWRKWIRIKTNKHYPITNEAEQLINPIVWAAKSYSEFDIYKICVDVAIDLEYGVSDVQQITSLIPSVMVDENLIEKSGEGIHIYKLTSRGRKLKMHGSFRKMYQQEFNEDKAKAWKNLQGRYWILIVLSGYLFAKFEPLILTHLQNVFHIQFPIARK